MVQIAVQAAIGGKILARENIKPYRKDVTAKLVSMCFDLFFSESGKFRFLVRRWRYEENEAFGATGRGEEENEDDRQYFGASGDVYRGFEKVMYLRVNKFGWISFLLIVTSFFERFKKNHEIMRIHEKSQQLLVIG